MKDKKMTKAFSPLVVVALALSLAALFIPQATLADAQDEGNLTWAPIYLDGTLNKIVLTNCPETVSFEWYQGGPKPKLSRYAYEGDDNVCFTVTLRNLDAADHDLNFTWADGDIAGVDWTITPDPVTIPAGGTANVTLCCDLSNTTTYPALPVGDWYRWYETEFDVGYDGLHATVMYFDVCVLPTDGSVPVMPTVELPFVHFVDAFSAQNMRLLYGVEGMHKVDFGVYECFVADRYDETAWAHVGYFPPNWEMNILDDGSVEIIAHHATLTAGLSDVTWDRTWYLTHEDPYLQMTDVYTNTGADPVSFSIFTYLINPGYRGSCDKGPRCPRGVDNVHRVGFLTHTILSHNTSYNGR